MAFSTTYGVGAVNPADGGSWNFQDTFRVVSDNGTSVRFTDVLSPLDKRTYLKFSLSKIADVYKTLGGDSVPVAERSSNSTGQTLFAELTTILTKPNPSIAGAIIQVPVQARVELRLPNDGDLTDANVVDLATLVFASLRGADGEPRIVSEMMRGVLVPAGL